jgi:polyhydroxyalkanoate synthase subunit PhaC
VSVTQRRTSPAHRARAIVPELLAPVEERSRGVAERAAAALDPTALGRSLARALWTAPRRQAEVSDALWRMATSTGAAAQASLRQVAGSPSPGPMQPEPRDRRFADPVWTTNPAFAGLLQAYLIGRQLFLDIVDASGLDEPAAAKARFGAELVADAVAPTNFLPMNPAALRKAAATGGGSVIRGAANFVRDVRSNGGWPRQVDVDAFEVGSDLAITPGKVVFRNEIFELIQYTPTTELVYDVPLLVCPPWINKYYIADLAPGRSLVEWAVSHGLTTFVISYRNPDRSMRDLRFEDYLLEGPDTAIEVVREIVGVDAVHTLGMCLGGTMNAALLAYHAAIGASPIRSSTFLNALTDFGDTGTLGKVFADRDAVDVLERRMRRTGCLDAAAMAHTFDLLRAQDLVFSYVEWRWLMGEQPRSFDLLAWNNDSTRMPARVHTEYLRRCYVENALVREEWNLGGVRLRPSQIEVDSYVVSAIDDHIVPWQAAYRTTQVIGGRSRFVLSTSGHIAGIVNPPGPKSRLWTNDELPADPADWLAGAIQSPDTWWNDWIDWITARSGDLRPPPSIGSADHQPLGDAPGTYVRG